MAGRAASPRNMLRAMSPCRMLRALTPSRETKQEWAAKKAEKKTKFEEAAKDGCDKMADMFEKVGRRLRQNGRSNSRPMLHDAGYAATPPVETFPLAGRVVDERNGNANPVRSSAPRSESTSAMIDEARIAKKKIDERRSRAQPRVQFPPAETSRPVSRSAAPRDGSSSAMVGSETLAAIRRIDEASAMHPERTPASRGSQDTARQAAASTPRSRSMASQGARTSSSNASASTQGTRRTSSNDDDDDTCIVCCDARANVLFAPCGHHNVCFGCAGRLTPKKCPSCRATFDCYVKLVGS